MKLPYILSAILSLPINLFANTIDVTADISTNTTWVSSNQYILKDYIFVTPGASLTIEAGTIIKADQASGDSAPCLIVTQVAQIYAIGTKDNPIVFTSVSDNGTNLSKDSKGLWGGLIILGNAPINSNGSNADNAPLTNAVEGVPTTSGISGRSIPSSYSQFGGTDSNDNSGTLQYVSIRHGGAEIGSGNEINGLTLGGVGAGTTMDHIEIYASKDDGIEIYGGSVNAKYLSVAYVGDDSFDFDQGYNGHLQFLLSIQDENSNRAIEWDGSFESDDLKADTSTLPDWSNPIISNMTLIGSGKSVTNVGGEGNTGLEIRDNGGGQVWNSIITEFGKSILDIEATSSSKGTQSTVNSATYGSQALLENGTLVFKGNIFWNASRTGDYNNTALGAVEGDSAASTVIFDAANSNSYNVDPLLLDAISLDGVISPFPYDDTNASLDSPALTGAVTSGLPTSITATTYRGAFAGSAATDNWMAGWTAIGADSATSGSSPILIADGNNSSSSSSSSSTASSFLGISTRGYISGTNYMYAGIAINGTADKKVAFMAKGPLLSGYGISDYLADPELEIYNAAGALIYSNSSHGTVTGTGAETISTYSSSTGITLPTGAVEAAIVVTLSPGNYTAILKGLNDSSGAAIIEAYEVE